MEQGLQGGRAESKGGGGTTSRRSKPSKGSLEETGKQRVVREPVVLSRAAPVVAPRKEDDYDDDFEAYEDDFEDDTPKPPAKAASRESPLNREKKQAKASKKEMQMVRESIELENTQMKREAKHAKREEK